MPIDHSYDAEFAASTPLRIEPISWAANGWPIPSPERGE